ncbi:MAG: dihydropteroate synthase, partial [Chloroflexota bacterium]
MKIIGEKINGTRKRVAQAISERDGATIRDLATRQVEAGAHWLDVNAGTHPAQEADDLVWLIEQVQAVTDAPLCLDSANPQAVAAAVEAVDKTPMINSISGEEKRLDEILPIVAAHGCQVIALAMDSKSVPSASQERIAIIRRVLERTRQAGVPDEQVFVDPLAMTIATDNNSAMAALETISGVRDEFPQCHFTIGLSNISFGLPARSQINRTFLTMAMQAGLDSAILDPLDRQLQATILTTELLLGRDRHCLNFVRAARDGR